ncbi:hypothetical protein J437_LFUL001931 [Ladona fulva]|uniref:Uncharacterized protein n=1 Tax=Ladona fulva TaxID=123851 RepID=A0A8K0JZ32_LADFU|nr:hypothetical protein J437_LFUL001931 [Ladona fulva]
MMACKVGEIHIQGDDYSEAAKRTIPSITLVDTNSAEDKIIAQELVVQGYARWTNKEPEDTMKGFVDDDSEADFDSFDE